MPSTTGTITGKMRKRIEKFEMKLADVIDELVFPGGSAGDDQNNRAVHRINVRSASTSRASFSRPCEATRM